ncbi:AI-2E family transporter [Georgenia faecalis]|uniref:AI-2E family transporter n=1 Tax=Georgenia faecalis TaxID=2483799 RepID=A0ABV9D978_9MICO|nr:AI-2E family transporter [Georgenia faecalis]
MSSPTPAVLWGRRAWATIGVVILVIGLVFVSSQVSIILTPFVLALFPAALLDPVAGRLRASRLPNALGALLLLLALLGVLALAAWFITSAVIDQVPEIVDSVTAGIERFEEDFDWSIVPGDIGSLSDLAAQAGSAIAGSGALTEGLGAATAVGEFATGTVLMLVTLFFFFKDGRRMWQAFLDFVPRRHQPRADVIARQSFWTIGAFLRAQLLVALVDAVFIGLGLWLLGVPLVIPLAVLVFIGGLFPIVGAFLSGTVAVVVAFADQGPLIALAALGVVLLVQQLEGNVLEPLIQGRIIALHPLLIILSVTAGGVLMGILGAFLAVPVAAVIARLVDNLRGRPPAVGPGSRRGKKDGKEADDGDPTSGEAAGDAARQTPGASTGQTPGEAGQARGGATATA